MNKIIKLLLTIDGFRIFAFGLLGPIYAIYVEKIGGDIMDAGIAFAAYSIMLGLTALIVGRIGDKYINPIKLMFAGYLFISLSFFFYIFVNNTIQFIFTQIFLGLGWALAAPTFDAFFSDHLDKKKKNTEWGNWEGENFILTGIAAIVGSAIAKFLGFKILFFIMGSTTLLSLIFIIILYQKTQNNINRFINFFK